MIVGQLSIGLWGSKQRKVRVNYVLLWRMYEVDTEIEEVEGRGQKVEKREKKKVEDGEESVSNHCLGLSTTILLSIMVAVEVELAHIMPFY